jgi:DMSO/TMAO reductase YedYZ heme-binding membrane subunit
LNETTAQGGFFGLCAALSLGPLYRFFPRVFGALIGMRRTFGVSSALFVAAHVFIALVPLWSELGWTYIREHVLMVSLGFCAALIILVLGGLSFQCSLDRVGVERWRRLQKLGYLAVVLACAHFLVLGKFSGWVEWFRTLNHPAPPGTLPVCIVGAVPLVLKGAELLRAPRGAAGGSVGR